MPSLLLRKLSLLLLMVGACAGNGPAGGRDAGGSGGAGGGNGSGSGGAGGASAATFPCGTTEQCLRDAQYCFAEMWNGATKIPHQCRPLPTGCSACDCAKADAAPASMACAGATPSGALVCIDGAAVVDRQASTRSLTVLCQVP
jgi:hypothetical protein